MALKRIDDVDGADLTMPYYRVQVIVTKVISEDHKGNVIKEEVLEEGALDMSLTNANKAVVSIGKDPIKV